MTPHDLNHLGIEHVLQIEGTLTEVNTAPNQPIVFLIDESHGHAPSIGENIANVQQLIDHANVRLIGVESHHPSDMGIGDQASDLVEATFANHFNDLPGVVVAEQDEMLNVRGVESRELFELMEQDTVDIPEADRAVYPVNYLRSYYFLLALFRHRRRLELDGNLVLNAGRNHIDHIRQLVAQGGAQQLAGTAASYIHIRATAFP
jgi:hypothetical protein